MDTILSLFPTLDIMILFLFVLVYLLHLLFIRKSKLFIDIVAVYVSLFCVAIVPLWIEPLHTFLHAHVYTRIIVFILLVVGLHVLLSFSNLKIFSRGVRPTDLGTSLLYRFAIVGLMFSVMIHILPDDIRMSLGGMVQILFASTWSLIGWLVFPLILAFAYRYKTEDGWLE